MSMCLIALSPVVAADDADGDGLEDGLEQALCGRALVANTMQVANDTAGSGYCAAPDDFVQGSALGIDEDGDGVPNEAESVMCAAQDNTTPDDGTCSGDDYTAPNVAGQAADEDGDALPDQSEAIICGFEDNDDPADGSCTGYNYTAPNVTLSNPPDPDALPIPQTDSDGDGVPDILEGTLCLIQDQNDPTDGSCSEGGDYTPPATPDAEGTIASTVAGTVGGAPLNCSGSTDAASYVGQVGGDADCDGQTNADEVAQGCDPLDGSSNGQCLTIPPLPPAPPLPPVPSSGNTCVDERRWAFGDSDCDGARDRDELEDGSNPLLSD